MRMIGTSLELMVHIGGGPDNHIRVEHMIWLCHTRTICPHMHTDRECSSFVENTPNTINNLSSISCKLASNLSDLFIYQKRNAHRYRKTRRRDLSKTETRSPVALTSHLECMSVCDICMCCSSMKHTTSLTQGRSTICDRKRSLPGVMF